MTVPDFPSRHVDRRRELLLDWERRCRARGGVEHTSGADALFLATALVNALRSGVETPELGRAARTWGARFAAPADAVTVLSVLRDTLMDWDRDAAGRAAVEPSVLNRLFDQMTIEAVDAAAGNLRAAARHDPLTGCANRRALDEDLPRALSSAQHSRLDMAVAVVDLDGLKQINDAEGHVAGDSALRNLVVALRGALREADTLYRTGGDEFVVVAPFTDGAGARAVMRRAERMGGPAFSWGVASLGELGGAGDGPSAAARSLTPLALLEAADTDLYRRRRTARQDAARAVRRRRYTAVASVAATIGATAGMSGLAAALDSGGTAAVSATGAPAPGQAGQAGQVSSAWHALPAPHVIGQAGFGHPTARHTGPEAGPATSSSTSLSDLLGQAVSMPSPPPSPAGTGGSAIQPVSPTVIGGLASPTPVILVTSTSGTGSGTTATSAVLVAPTTAGTTTTSTTTASGPGNSANGQGVPAHGSPPAHGPASHPGQGRGR